MSPGILETLTTDIHRIVAPNPGMMTGPGTNTYLIGQDRIAVIDPGPKIEPHIEQIVAQSPGSIEWILVTHTHPDHSPGANRLRELTGAMVLGMTHNCDDGHQDLAFAADGEVGNGDVIAPDVLGVSAIHTPGHASNHLCYLHQASGWLFTGDHIMNGSTVVINPPDGDMAAYLNSLEILRQFPITHIAPGHGDVIDKPWDAVSWIVQHRLEREKKVVAQLQTHPNKTLSELVIHVYDEVDPRLHGWAERSLLAHLLKLKLDGRVTEQEGRWIYTS